jgi:hypothetical protein
MDKPFNSIAQFDNDAKACQSSHLARHDLAGTNPDELCTVAANSVPRLPRALVVDGLAAVMASIIHISRRAEVPHRVNAHH